MAMSQIGNVGGEPYWSWYGFSYRVEWCACFISWCANQCGYLEAGVIPKVRRVGTGEDWFKARACGRTAITSQARGYHILRLGPGRQCGSCRSRGKAEDGWVYTIEGNSNDACRERRYAPLAMGRFMGMVRRNTRLDACPFL